MKGSSAIDILKRYRLVVSIFAIVSIFFLATHYEACVLALQTLFSKNTLLLIVTTQPFILGGSAGFVILIVISFWVCRKGRAILAPTMRELVAFVLLLIWSIILIDILYISSSIDDIVRWSNIFMGIDRDIFSTYPVFFMYAHYNPIFERIIVWSYNYLPILAACWTGFLIASKRLDEFRQWSKNIFLALGFCIPLWIAFPAIQPLSMYFINIFDQPVPSDISRGIAMGPPSTFINQYTLASANIWIDASGIRKSVSNFPSMHAIWGLLLLYSIARTFRSKFMNLIFFSVAFANMLGAIYTLEHYAVDIGAGILIFIFVIYCSRRTAVETADHLQLEDARLIAANGLEVPAPERAV